MNHRPFLLATALLLAAVPAAAQQASVGARLRFQARYGAPPWLAVAVDTRGALRVRAADLAAAAEVRAIVRSTQVDFGAQSRVAAATDAVAARDTLSQFLVGVALAPGTKHAARFGMAFDPFASQFVGALSGDENAWVAPLAAAASPLLAASVLAPDERWSLSENPVRSARVMLNFAEPARAVRV